MTDARDGSSRTIRQFHFLTWPEDTEVPRQADHFIDLIGQVRFLPYDLVWESLMKFKKSFRFIKLENYLEFRVRSVSIVQVVLVGLGSF